MPGKTLTPDQITEAVCLRAAGYTISAISERLGASVRTLNRVFERHSATKGAVMDELVTLAKKQLVDAITSNDRIREEAARIVADDLAHARLLRQRMADASEHLTATNLYEAALLMRAAAAYSTAIKNTSDMLRHSLRTERAIDAQDEQELPVLVVREITGEEALQMRQEHADEAGGLDVGPPTSEGTEAHSEAVEDNERVEEGEDAAA